MSIRVETTYLATCDYPDCHKDYVTLESTEEDAILEQLRVPDRAGLQSVIDVIGEHYLHLAREWGWNDTEVRDAMYVETKQRGWCRE